MKKFAKLLAMVLAVSMVLTMFVGAVDYKDAASIAEDKAAAVQTVYEAGIMMGNDKDEFNPTKYLTRDEMAKIMFALASADQKAADYYSVVASVSFNDFASIPAWSKNFVGYAAAYDIIVGTAEGNANALGTLSYVEAAIMLMRSLDLEETYNDGGEEPVASFTGSKWYQNAVLCAYENGLFEDLDITNFMASITREDVAVMIANAMDHANAAYELATPVNGVVIGVAENEDEEEIFVLAGDYEEEIKTEGYDVDAVIGHEINAIVEGDATLDLNVVDALYEGKVTIGDVAVEKVPTADEDDDEEALNDYFSLLVNEEVVLDNANKATKYLSVDGADYSQYNDGIRAWFANEDDFQAVSLIVNENSIFISYAPVYFFQFDNSLLTEEYDPDEKIYTGEYLYDGNAFPYGKIEVEDGTVCVAQIIDNTYVNLDFVDVVSSADLDVAFNAKDAEYSVSYEGTELYNYAGANYANIWTDVMTEAEDMFAFIYNGEVLVAYEEISEETTSSTEISYVIVTDYSASVEVGKNDDDETVYVWTTTIKALNLLGEEVEIVYEADEQADVAYVAPFGIAVDTFFKVTVTDGEFAGMEAVADPTYAGLFMDYEGEADLLVNYTNMEVELDDITTEVKNGNTVVKIGDTVVAGASLVVFELSDATIVVYDPAYEFGVFADFMPEE